jgi:signal transduction histidine kinase
MPAVKRVIWAVASTAAAALATATIIAIGRGWTDTVRYLFMVPVPFTLAGLYLLWRRPSSRAAWLLVCGTGFTMSYSVLLEQILRTRYLEVGIESWMSWALMVDAVATTPVGLGCLALLIALFPTGRAKTRSEARLARTMWLLPLPMLLAQLANEQVLIETVTYGGLGPFRNPIHIEALSWLGPATASMRSLLAVTLVVAIWYLLVRYRRESGAERRQIRWVLYGSTLAIAIAIVPFALAPILDTMVLDKNGILLTAGAVALLLIPITVVVGIEQPTWLDTDEVIRKSFGYAALSIGIFAVYAAVAAGLGLAAGARLPLEVAIGVTAVLAFAFQPAQRRLQLVADRWVFGDQPTPLEAVATFDRSIRAPETPSALGELLADTVRRAARLHWVTVDLPPEPEHTSGARRGEPAFETTIGQADDRYGRIACGPKVRGQFTGTDQDLIEALAGQAALVISNARLATRIVQAQEAERRRLERNIHDGAQQELVALVAKLGLARARARQGALDDATLVELQRDAGTILKELRELAQGIHPSVLTDGGLVEAVQDRCSRLPIEVAVSITPGLRSERFSDDVEGAAYFFVTEGLTNVLKHAEATKAEVAIDRASGHLELRVTDDGAGFDPATTRWNGLEGLRDRFTALGGEVTVRSRPDRGTVLKGRVPIEDPR